MTSVQDFAEPHVVIRARAEVGEGPVFDPRTGLLVWVDITRGGEPVAARGPGDFFGEISMVDRGEATATVTAVTDSTVWCGMPPSASSGNSTA